MDNNTSLILINLIINLLLVIDHFLTRLKKSKCFGTELEFNDKINEDKDDKKPNIQNSNFQARGIHNL